MKPFGLNLTGGHILITGGSKGMGRVIAQSYLNEGVNVSFCARTVAGDEFSTFLKESPSSAKIIGTAVDIGDRSQIQQWVEKAVQQLGQIDAVIANASPLIRDPNPEAWQKSFEADVLGLIALVETTVPHLEKRATEGKTTSIVVISSIAGFETRHPSIGGPYTTFKRAQATLAKDYARQLAPRGVRINTIIPGTIENPSITKDDGTVVLSTFKIVKRDMPDFYNSLVAAIPMRRTGIPEEIAPAVLFLTSDLASYITGSNLVIDGGMSMFL